MTSDLLPSTQMVPSENKPYGETEFLLARFQPYKMTRETKDQKRETKDQRPVRDQRETKDQRPNTKYQKRERDQR